MSAYQFIGTVAVLCLIVFAGIKAIRHARRRAWRNYMHERELRHAGIKRYDSRRVSHKPYELPGNGRVRP